MSRGRPTSVSATPPVCPHCLYIGHAHLCGCMGKLGVALRTDDLEAAKRQFKIVVDNANEAIR